MNPCGFRPILNITKITLKDLNNSNEWSKSANEHTWGFLCICIFDIWLFLVGCFLVANGKVWEWLNSNSTNDSLAFSSFAVHFSPFASHEKLVKSWFVMFFTMSFRILPDEDSSYLRMLKGVNVYQIDNYDNIWPKSPISMLFSTSKFLQSKRFCLLYN